MLGVYCRLFTHMHTHAHTAHVFTSRLVKVMQEQALNGGN